VARTRAARSHAGRERCCHTPCIRFAPHASPRLSPGSRTHAQHGGSHDRAGPSSSALSPPAARPRAARRVRQRAARIAGTSARRRQRPANARRRTRGNPNAARRDTRRHVATRRTKRHRARLSAHPTGRPASDTARSAERVSRLRPTLAIRRPRGACEARPPDEARRDSSRATPRGLRHCVAAPGEASRRRARIRNNAGAGNARGARRLPTRHAQSRRTPEARAVPVTTPRRPRP